jgi:hypothetical protein
MNVVHLILPELQLITLVSCSRVSPRFTKEHSNLVLPLIQLNTNKIMIGRGEQVMLDCRVMAGTPTPTLRWFKDGRELYPHHGLIIHEGRLTIQVRKLSFPSK